MISGIVKEILVTINNVGYCDKDKVDKIKSLIYNKELERIKDYKVTKNVKAQIKAFKRIMNKVRKDWKDPKIKNSVADLRYVSVIDNYIYFGTGAYMIGIEAASEFAKAIPPEYSWSSSTDDEKHKNRTESSIREAMNLYLKPKRNFIYDAKYVDALATVNLNVGDGDVWHDDPLPLMYYVPVVNSTNSKDYIVRDFNAQILCDIMLILGVDELSLELTEDWRNHITSHGYNDRVGNYKVVFTLPRSNLQDWEHELKERKNKEHQQHIEELLNGKKKLRKRVNKIPEELPF